MSVPSKLKISEEAENELIEYSRFYEEKRPGYGIAFENQFFDKLTHLVDYPFQGREIKRRADSYRIVRFPSSRPRFNHVIVFRIEEKAGTIIVEGIPHTSTDWKSEFER